MYVFDVNKQLLKKIDSRECALRKDLSTEFFGEPGKQLFRKNNWNIFTCRFYSNSRTDGDSAGNCFPDVT